jgi:hypothetical protein
MREKPEPISLARCRELLGEEADSLSVLSAGKVVVPTDLTDIALLVEFIRRFGGRLRPVALIERAAVIQRMLRLSGPPTYSSCAPHNAPPAC